MTVHNYVIDDFCLYWLNKSRKFIKLIFAKKSQRRQCDTNLNQYDEIFLSEFQDSKINLNKLISIYLLLSFYPLKIVSVLNPDA